MSSFNIGGPSNKPQVTEAQNMMNNGGGGNTGYMQGRGKKKKKPEEMIDPVILEGEAEDKFEYVEDEYEDDDDYYNTSGSSNENAKSSFDASKTDDKFIKEGKEEPVEEDKNPAKLMFGLIDKFADKIDKMTDKTVKKRDDDNPGGDFLSLSGKDI